MLERDPFGFGVTVVQVHRMMKFKDAFRDYWRCVSCGRRVESEAAAMRHRCTSAPLEGSGADTP